MSYYNIINNHNFRRRESTQDKNNNLIIKDYTNEIDSLKSHISNLESQIQELKSQIRLLGDRNIALNEYEHENITLNMDVKQLKQKISDLEQSIISILKKGKEEKRDITNSLENELSNYKRIVDTVKGKIEAADHIIKLNEIQHNYILKLEQEIEDIKLKNDEKMKELKIEHDLHYKHLKNKMIDLIKKSNNDIRKENTTNIELYSKFSAINKIEIQEELEKQNKAIMKLIKENETKDKQILNLTQEKDAYYSVDKILKKQNLKFSQLIKNFNDKKIDENNKCYNSNKNILFKATMVNEKQYSKYDELLKKYKILKNKLEYALDKERTFQKKYYGIIKLYNTALKNFLNDEQIITEKININLDKFIEGDIDTYTQEEKVQIICLLIKHLLPLIKVESTEIIKLRNLFNNIDIKIKINSGSSTFYSRNQNSNIIKSFCNIRQFASDLNYSIKKKEKLKQKNKSIYNTYNNTYNNFNHNNNIINLMNSKEESKSIKSSMFGLNIDASIIKKKKETKLDEFSINDNNNKFILSAFNFYKSNNKISSKNSEIKLYKKGLLKNELMKNHLPLQRLMFFNEIDKKTSDNKKQSSNKNQTENNIYSQ